MARGPHHRPAARGPHFVKYGPPWLYFPKKTIDRKMRTQLANEHVYNKLKSWFSGEHEEENEPLEDF